jgi:hypothetical protein
MLVAAPLLAASAGVISVPTQPQLVPAGASPQKPTELHTTRRSTRERPPIPALALLARSRHLAARSGPSCPLSLAQQVKSVKAFREMLPVLHHPRCFNCHGGFDITSDEHEGSDVAKSSGLDPRSLLTLKERKELHEACGSCHDNVRGTATRLDGTVLAGWFVAPKPMLWDGRSDDDLCMEMKRFETDGDQFIEHMELDHNEIQFLEAAFNGDRALGEALKSYGLQVDKPPGTQADLVALARKWVDIMGARAKWVGDLECGCVKPRIDLEMKSEIAFTARGQGRMTMQVSATVPLTPDTSGLVFTGTAPLQHGPYTLQLPPGCRTDWSKWHGELAVHEARFDVDTDQRMTISLGVFPTQSGGTVTLICPELPVAIPPLVMYWAGQWQNLHRSDIKGNGYFFDGFDAASGLSLAGERKLVGRKEVTRSKLFEGITFRSKTTFEFWWVGLERTAN